MRSETVSTENAEVLLKLFRFQSDADVGKFSWRILAIILMHSFIEETKKKETKQIEKVAFILLQPIIEQRDASYMMFTDLQGRKQILEWGLVVQPSEEGVLN